ncbi:MAG TPA: class I SAM-dependent methyltransferase [Acidobacteriota bacterium]|nr:class I SAM-dependent methyltransferase [Acidobacteriota bacterium]
MPAMDYSRVAHYYDSYVQTSLDVNFFLQESKNAIRVLELMSGTGRLSLPLIQAGVNLTCVDSSPEMLAILRQKLMQQNLQADVFEMDVCQMSLAGEFDLIVIPFHSFAEILDPPDQRRALEEIFRLLSPSGRFICTLHNPPVRLKSVDGKVTFLGKHTLPDNTGTLLLSTVQQYEASTHRVKGAQFYELYDTSGVMQSKWFVDLEFYLHQKNDFSKLIQSIGFSTLNLYGDYSHSAFVENSSPFMLWVLGKALQPAK